MMDFDEAKDKIYDIASDLEDIANSVRVQIESYERTGSAMEWMLFWTFYEDFKAEGIEISDEAKKILGKSREMISAYFCDDTIDRKKEAFRKRYCPEKFGGVK